MPFDAFNTDLSDDQLRHQAPSVFATAAAPTVSDKYVYVPSYQIVRDLRLMGLSPVRVREGSKRDPDGRAYALHEIRFRNLNQPVVRELGTLVPEVILRNSHDRTSGLSISAGIFRLVCLNGMTVADNAYSLAVKHVGQQAREAVATGVGQILGKFGEVVDVCRYWHSIELSPDHQLTFAKKALEIRGSSLEADPMDAIRSRRWDDRKPTLWNTFNSAQENLTTGRVQGRNEQGGFRRISRIRTIKADSDLNRKLWLAAAAMAEEVSPRSGAVVGAAA